LENSRPKPERTEETLEGGRGPPRVVAPLERERERERESEREREREREGVTRTCRRLYNYELHYCYSQNIREINTRMMILIGYSARMTIEKFVYGND
jgi:hypothetical protein